MEMEKIKQVSKSVSVYVFYMMLIGIGFFIGSTWKELHLKPIQRTQAIQKKEISIAINESNQLMIVDKKTGGYVTYSDSIANTIFTMYASRLSQKVTKDQK